jgi:hypothetical protein
LTKWRPSGSSYATSSNGLTAVTPWGTQAAGSTQDHCPAVGAVGAASPATCTLLNPATLQVGVPLTDYPTTDGSVATGAIMTLSQRPVRSFAGLHFPSKALTVPLTPSALIRTAPTWPAAAQPTRSSPAPQSACAPLGPEATSARRRVLACLSIGCH